MRNAVLRFIADRVSTDWCRHWIGFSRDVATKLSTKSTSTHLSNLRNSFKFKLYSCLEWKRQLPITSLWNFSAHAICSIAMVRIILNSSWILHLPWKVLYSFQRTNFASLVCWMSLQKSLESIPQQTHFSKRIQTFHARPLKSTFAGWKENLLPR